MLQQKLGRYDRSFDMLTQARDGYARTLGEEHPQTLTMIQNLGATEVLRGRFSEARALFQQAFEARTRTLGAAHPHTLLTQIQLGRSYTALGQPGAACELLADAVARPTQTVTRPSGGRGFTTASVWRPRDGSKKRKRNCLAHTKSFPKHQ